MTAALCTSFPGVLANSDQQNEHTTHLDATGLKIVYSIILLPALIFLILAFLDARCFRINHYFNAGSIIQALVGFLDFISDDLFALQLTFIFLDGSHDDERAKVALLMICSYFFIGLPMMLGLAQLLRQNQKEWIHSVQLRNWMRKHSHFVAWGYPYSLDQRSMQWL